MQMFFALKQLQMKSAYKIESMIPAMKDVYNKLS